MFIGTRHNPAWLLLLAAALLAAGCAAKTIPSSPENRPAAKELTAAPPPQASPAPAPAPVPAAPALLFVESGIASWRGRDLQGTKTASGTPFDMDSLSAAHRTLPLGTEIRVTNLDNSRSVDVKVIDRGPFSGKAVLDLSFAAARDLAFVAQGTARVKIETIGHARPGGSFTVQAAVFSEKENAELLKDRLSRRFEVIRIVPFPSKLGTFYRVEVGSYRTPEKAQIVAGRLKSEGLEPYVMRKD